jgi:3-dehydroquinate synthase
VSIGMVLAYKFSSRMNLASPDDGVRVAKHLSEVGLPISLKDIDGELPPTDILMEHIAQDKKVSRGELTFILTRGVGQSFVANNVPMNEVSRFLEEIRN